MKDFSAILFTICEEVFPSGRFIERRLADRLQMLLKQEADLTDIGSSCAVRVLTNEDAVPNASWTEPSSIVRCRGAIAYPIAH
jgi:hypothetical protein